MSDFDPDKCTIGVAVTEKVEGVREYLSSMDKRNAEDHRVIRSQMDRINETVDKVRNRLPVWAVVAFTLLGTALGALLAVAIQNGMG